MKFWPYWNFRGLYYIMKWRFSLNEGHFPNIHIDITGPYVYIAIAPYVFPIPGSHLINCLCIDVFGFI